MEIAWNPKSMWKIFKHQFRCCIHPIVSKYQEWYNFSTTKAVVFSVLGTILYSLVLAINFSAMWLLLALPNLNCLSLITRLGLISVRGEGKSIFWFRLLFILFSLLYITSLGVILPLITLVYLTETIGMTFIGLIVNSRVLLPYCSVATAVLSYIVYSLSCLWTSLRATDCQGYLVPVFLLYLFCNGIKPMLAQELIGTSEIYSGTIGCL